MVPAARHHWSSCGWPVNGPQKRRLAQGAIFHAETHIDDRRVTASVVVALPRRAWPRSPIDDGTGLAEPVDRFTSPVAQLPRTQLKLRSGARIRRQFDSRARKKHADCGAFANRAVDLYSAARLASHPVNLAQPET